MPLPATPRPRRDSRAAPGTPRPCRRPRWPRRCDTDRRSRPVAEPSPLSPWWPSFYRQACSLNDTPLGACTEESEYFFEDLSDEIILDDLLARLLTSPNVIVTSHQGFLT